MKVSIIGGAGRVGADAAYALQFGCIVREIALVDIDEDTAAGEALDLRHGASLTANQTITSGGYGELGGSDCVVITAGLRRKPDESRLELINRNVVVFKEIMKNVAGAKLADGATILVVSNPVDILTYLAVRADIVPAERVLGLGTVLDTTRFRSLIADRLKVNATDVSALILGEHGDSMVPIWSSATIGGAPLRTVPEFNDELGHELFEITKKSGAEVIRQKGGAGRAVGVAIKEVVESIALNAEQVLPVSALQGGIFGLEDVCLSLPTVVGRSGAKEIWEPEVSDDERAGIEKSGASLREVLEQIGA